MPDQSHLDQRYFIDDKVYNCPFCNRRHVSYSVLKIVRFHWTDGKECRAFFVMCDSCHKTSMHLTFTDILKTLSNFDGSVIIDNELFYSVPTSFFVTDERVPHVLRVLLTEAEGCLKSNFLTGASACARKIIYELAQIENSTGNSYSEQIKSLKSVHPEVDSAYFDTLLTIQQVTSSKVHENSHDGWEAKHLRVILAALSEILYELYVIPAVKGDRRKSVLALKNELVGE